MRAYTHSQLLTSGVATLTGIRRRKMGPVLVDTANGAFSGSAEDALDCACGLYLGQPQTWTDTPTN
jgi:hypothetical protein